MHQSILERFSDEMLLHNKTVKAAYQAITSEIISLSATFNQPELRTRIETEFIPELDQDLRIHEFITPYIQLTLSIASTGQYTIAYGINNTSSLQSKNLDHKKLKAVIHRSTDILATAIDINASVFEFTYRPEEYDKALAQIHSGVSKTSKIIIEEAPTLSY